MTFSSQSDSFRFLVAGWLVLTSSYLMSDEENGGIDCDSLPESKRALCKLLEQCSFIDDESTRQRCYELALGDETVDEEGNLLENLDDVLDWLEEDSGAVAEEEPELDLQSNEESEADSDQEESKPRKRRGLLGRLAGAVTAPVRAVLPGRKDNSDEDSDSDEQEIEKSDGNENTTRWEATIERVGRVDRDVHLVLLDDGKLFEYISPEELRFRKNDKVEIIHVQSWLTEKYRIDGNRGAIKDALLIPCDRKDLKGTMKRKCKLMGLLD